MASLAQEVSDAGDAAHSRRLVESAVRLVAGGDSPRVLLVGIHADRLLLREAQERASRAGVQARALWRGDACDIAIERGG